MGLEPARAASWQTGEVRLCADDLRRLRLRLLTAGLVVADQASRAWHDEYGGPLSLGEYATTAGVSLRLDHGLCVNAPVSPEAADCSIVLNHDAQGFFLATPLGRVKATPIPVPAWVERRKVDRMDGIERPFSSFGVTHTDRCRISPIAGCAWKCEFCELPYELRYRRKHALDLLDVVEAAVADAANPARHVLISGGTPRRVDEPWLDEVFATVAERSPVPVDVMMSPRTCLDYPGWLRRVGVNSVSINLEVFDEDIARVMMPQKARLGRDYFLRFIEAAVNEFGVGFVQSLVLVGSAIEPIESTAKAVRALAERGCVPVLSPFRPHSATPLGLLPAATFEEAVEALKIAEDICSDAGTGVRPGPRCVECHHNTIASADDDSFYCYANHDLAAR